MTISPSFFDFFSISLFQMNLSNTLLEVRSDLIGHSVCAITSKGNTVRQIPCFGTAYICGSVPDFTAETEDLYLSPQRQTYLMTI